MAIGNSSGSSAKNHARKNAERAAEMKKLGIERTTGRCAQCYRIITIESRKSKYNHMC